MEIFAGTTARRRVPGVPRTGPSQHASASVKLPSAYPEEVRAWKAQNGASIKGTAKHFNLSDSTVKRYCSGTA
jgi:putative DNA-invertase from lambdoid prophage Rac